ncbi:MAG: DUF6273 domain-containing protein [Acutalibacteraceae bacterium]
MATKLAEKPVGSNVKMNLNGAQKEFIIIHQGLPSSMYDSSCNGTWMLFKDVYTQMDWDSSNNDYKNSGINSYLNETFLNLFDDNIKSAIKQVKIPYQNGTGSGGSVASGANGLSCKIFLLSGYELGITTSDESNLTMDGAKLSYFEPGYEIGARSIRMAYFNGSAVNWWLRSVDTRNTQNAFQVMGSGAIAPSKCNLSIWVRPALILPQDLYVTDDGEVVTNQPPTTPSYISFETPKAGKNLGISWGESTDPDGDTIDYLLERQVDTGEWAQIAKTSATRYTDVCPSSGTNVNYRVKANDRKGGESDYRTGTAKEIVYNQPPSVPASITFGDPHAGKPLQITCEASTDPDGNPITYIWERQIDSGGWTQIGSGAETSITDTVPSSGTNINYRVKARDSEGAESGYRTGSAKAIIYNQPPTIPGVPQYKYPIPGEEMPVKWQASADPENGTVTYIVETKLGDGEWTQARETPETSCLVSVPQVSAVETMITVRVKAKDQEGAESAYSTGETVEILYHKVIRKIPWQRGKPFKARQYTYNGKKQYQTMREGALAGIEAKP